jgi:hypothetical protein
MYTLGYLIGRLHKSLRRGYRFGYDGIPWRRKP